MDNRETLKALVELAKKASNAPWACKYESPHENRLITKHMTQVMPGYVMVQRDFPAMTPDNTPEEFHLHSEDAINGYTDGWNACRKAMLAAAQPPKGEGKKEES